MKTTVDIFLDGAADGIEAVKITGAYGQPEYAQIATASRLVRKPRVLHIHDVGRDSHAWICTPEFYTHYFTTPRQVMPPRSSMIFLGA